MNDQRPAWVVTGPTSGIGYRTALELAAYGTVVLVGRNADKLAAVQRQIEDVGGVATPVVADFGDVFSTRQAASQVAALDLSVRGVLNNAGIMLSKPATSPQGWELAFATNHLGPLAFTDALVPTRRRHERRVHRLRDRGSGAETCGASRIPWQPLRLDRGSGPR